MNEQKVKVVGLEGNARYLRLLAGVPETKGMKSGYVILQPGESVGEHSTDAKEEAVIILEGTVQVFVEGKPSVTAKKEQVVYFPALTRHDMKNIGGGAARYVYVVAPVIPEAQC
jgi:quercetin dioxygenase-like cupin family protein